jgi:acylphosphatase
MSDIIARRCYVSGRVQGVFYRASTRQRAIELGLRGYAKNLPDGRVEVLACGDPAAVAKLCDWLWFGPPAAQVSGVEIEDVLAGALAGGSPDFRTG